jgi:thymidylate synthase
MEFLDRIYTSALGDVLFGGTEREDRTGVGTISLFGLKVTYDISRYLPLLTTKKVSFKNIAVELLWFLKGDTNIDYLVENGVTIWNEWADELGDLGPIYGKQWRDFIGVDQIAMIESQLKNDPFSRRIILSAWNPGEIQYMALPPCHMMAQFYVRTDGYLDCQLYQRSADMFLGVPYNIASYSLLTYMLAHTHGFRPGRLIHVIGDAHIYSNHVKQVREQYLRTPRQSPQLVIKRKCDSILDYTLDDFVIVGYDPHPAIPAPVAV